MMNNTLFTVVSFSLSLLLIHRSWWSWYEILCLRALWNFIAFFSVFFLFTEGFSDFSLSYYIFYLHAHGITKNGSRIRILSEKKGSELKIYRIKIFFYEWNFFISLNKGWAVCADVEIFSLYSLLFPVPLFYYPDGEINFSFLSFQSPTTLCNLGVGATFGESVLSDMPRDSTVVTKTSVELLRVEQQDFRLIFEVSKCGMFKVWKLETKIDFVVNLNFKFYAISSNIYIYHRKTRIWWTTSL